MSKNESPTGLNLTMQLTQAVADGASLPNTRHHSTAQILAAIMAAGGSERIDPRSLLSGQTPR